MKTTGVVVLMLLLIVFLILLIPNADKFTPARSTGTSVTGSVTTILIPPKRQAQFTRACTHKRAMTAFGTKRT